MLALSRKHKMIVVKATIHIVQTAGIFEEAKVQIEKYFGISRQAVQQMIDSTKNMLNDRSGDNGFQNTKVFLFDEYAVLRMQNINVRNVATQDVDLKHLERLSETLFDLEAQGVGVVPILAFQSDNGNGYIIQSRAKGSELYDRDKMDDTDYVIGRVELLSNAPQEHYDKFVEDTIKIIDAGVLIDFIGKDNFFYDETMGFQFIDLCAHSDYEYGLADTKPQGRQIAAYYCFLPCYFDTMPHYRNTVTIILSELADEQYNLLKECNNSIFIKCKIAMINNGISEEMINEAIANKVFSQLEQVTMRS